jgi:hypothetical protein
MARVSYAILLLAACGRLLWTSDAEYVNRTIGVWTRLALAEEEWKVS